MFANKNSIINFGRYHMCRGPQAMIAPFAGASGAIITFMPLVNDVDSTWQWVSTK